MLERAAALKNGAKAADFSGKAMGSIYFNSSLRTRASFDVACGKLGLTPVVAVPGKGAWAVETAEGVVMDGDKAEHAKEMARVMGSYVDVLGVRAFPDMEDFDQDNRQELLKLIARESPSPVINLESPLAHPCQELADLQTLREFGVGQAGAPVLVTWAYHPRALPQAVGRSALHGVAWMGADITLAYPEGFDLEPEYQEEMAALARSKGGDLKIVNDPDKAYDGQRAVYVKSWSPRSNYGKPTPANLSNWIVNDARMARTDDAIFMHCLPVRRNVVVSDGVLDGPRNASTAEAVNRIWAQTAMLEALLGGKGEDL